MAEGLNEPRYSPDLEEVLSQIRTTLESYRYVWADEAQLQAGIYLVLDGCFLHPQREVRLTPGERIDFLCTSLGVARIGVEVKVAGTAGAAMAQLIRYAPHVDALILVTTRHRHAAIPRELGGKPVEVAVIGGRQ